ncbi:MAG: ATP-dependent DNA helicase [Rubrivivax sp.]
MRSLCEFTAKRGDLDRRFTPAATALEGIRSQQTIAARRGQDYETEIALEGVRDRLRVRGRADGYDPRRRCLEEIKTIRGQPEDIPANRRLLHWAQLQTYGALFCRARGLEEIALALVYFDVASQTETELRQVFGADELEAVLAERCEAFSGWAGQEAAHRAARDRGLRELAFPQSTFRAGQRELAAAVYRTTTAGRSLLAQAPTGIGKTIGTLFPLLRAVQDAGIDKVAYLTCKGTGRITALETLGLLRAGTAGQALRVVAMTPTDQACVYPDKACHGDACPLARGFYDRLAPAREEAVARGWLDAAAQREVALRHDICPYYLGQELVRWADVLVGDVHHLFDGNGQLWGLLQALDWKLAVLVDEAHNLVERTRQMYSAELTLDALRTAIPTAPASAQSALEHLAEAAQALAADCCAAHEVLDEVPDAFTQALVAASGALSEHFQQQPLAVGSLLNFHFALQRFARLVEALGDHSLFDIRQNDLRHNDLRHNDIRTNDIRRNEPGSEDPADAGEAQEPDVVLAVRNVAPAVFLRPRLQALHSITLFSATLSPPDYSIQLLGLPQDTAWIDVPPAFPAEHLTVQVAGGLSTRFTDRGRSLGRLVSIIAQQYEAHPGNYLAFFSSFDYLEQVAAHLAKRHPGIAQWRQDRRMGAQARQAFLAQFRPDERGIGFAVLGGVFAEGVDLPGSLLIGAFIATLGLPPVSPIQEHFKARLKKLFGGDHGYADLVPAMQKVVQAAGRVLRTPEDRGWLWLLDDRYLQREVAGLLPTSWGLGQTARGFEDAPAPEERVPHRVPDRGP